MLSGTITLYSASRSDYGVLGVSQFAGHQPRETKTLVGTMLFG